MFDFGETNRLMKEAVLGLAEHLVPDENSLSDKMSRAESVQSTPSVKAADDLGGNLATADCLEDAKSLGEKQF